MNVVVVLPRGALQLRLYFDCVNNIILTHTYILANKSRYIIGVACPLCVQCQNKLQQHMSLTY